MQLNKFSSSFVQKVSKVNLLISSFMIINECVFLVGIGVFVILLGLKGANKVIACHNRKKCPPLSNIVIYIFSISFLRLM